MLTIGPCVKTARKQRLQECYQHTTNTTTLMTSSVRASTGFSASRRLFIGLFLQKVAIDIAIFRLSRPSQALYSSLMVRESGFLLYGVVWKLVLVDRYDPAFVSLLCVLRVLWSVQCDDSRVLCSPCSLIIQSQFNTTNLYIAYKLSNSKISK